MAISQISAVNIPEVAQMLAPKLKYYFMWYAWLCLRLPAILLGISFTNAEFKIRNIETFFQMILNDRFLLGIANWFYKNVELIFWLFCLDSQVQNVQKEPFGWIELQIERFRLCCWCAEFLRFRLRLSSIN